MALDSDVNTLLVSRPSARSSSFLMVALGGRHAQLQRTTVAINLGCLAEHNARERVSGTTSREGPGLQELEGSFIVRLLQRAVFERKPRVNAGLRATPPLVPPSAAPRQSARRTGR
jgi:hypothetical protein